MTSYISASNYDPLSVFQIVLNKFKDILYAVCNVFRPRGIKAFLGSLICRRVWVKAYARMKTLIGVER